MLISTTRNDTIILARSENDDSIVRNKIRLSAKVSIRIIIEHHLIIYCLFYILKVNIINISYPQDMAKMKKDHQETYRLMITVIKSEVVNMILLKRDFTFSDINIINCIIIAIANKMILIIVVAVNITIYQSSVNILAIL